MKRILVSLLALFSLAAATHASPETHFVDKVWKALGSKQANAFVDLYYQGLPKELEPTFRDLWSGMITEPVASVAIQPPTKADMEHEQSTVDFEGKTYVRNAPVKAYLILTFKDTDKTIGRFPLSVVDGQYYLSSWRVQ